MPSSSSSSILQSGGIYDPNEGGLIVMAVQVVMTGVAVLLMDRAGRRLLLLISLGGMTIFAGALAAFHYNGAKPAWLALTSLVGYIVFFSLGLGAIPWLIMGEIFPGDVRALAASAATLLNWCLSFIVTESFASLLSALGRQHLRRSPPSAPSASASSRSASPRRRGRPSRRSRRCSGSAR